MSDQCRPTGAHVFFCSSPIPGSGASSRAQKIEWLRLRPGLWDGKVFGDDLQFLIKCALVDAGLYSRKTVTVDMHIADLLASATDRDRPYLVGDRVLSRAREDVVGGHGLKATGRLKFSRPRAGPPRGATTGRTRTGSRPGPGSRPGAPAWASNRSS